MPIRDLRAIFNEKIIVCRFFLFFHHIALQNTVQTACTTCTRLLATNAWIAVPSAGLGLPACLKGASVVAIALSPAYRQLGHSRVAFQSRKTAAPMPEVSSSAGTHRTKTSMSLLIPSGEIDLQHLFIPCSTWAFISEPSTKYPTFGTTMHVTTLLCISGFTWAFNWKAKSGQSNLDNMLWNKHTTL